VLGIGCELSLRLVEDRQPIAEGVLYLGATADRDIEGLHQRLRAGSNEIGKGPFDVLNDKIDLGLELGVDDKLGVGVRKAEGDRLWRSPENSMAEPIAVEGNGSIKISGLDQIGVDLPEKRAAH
jgi:hypothetical protein